MDHTKLHNLKVLGLIFFCGVSFLVDLLSPWAVVSCVYASVIFFAVLFLPKTYLFPLTGIISALMVSGFLLQDHSGAWLSGAANHLLVLVVLWQLALLGWRYRNPGFSEEDLFSLAAEEAVAVVFCKPNSFIETCNKGFEKLTGFSAPELAGRFLHTLLPAGGKDLVRDILQRIHAGEDHFQGEGVLLKKNRIPLEVSWLVSARRRVPGALVSFVVYFRDGTREQEEKREYGRERERQATERQRFMDILDFEDRLRTVSDPRLLITMIVSEVARILQAEKCSLMSVDPLSGQIKIKGYKGIDQRIVEAVSLMKGDPVAGWVAQDRQDILVRDIETDARIARANRPTYVTKSFMSVPVYYKEEIVGVINVADHESGRAFDEFDFKILSRLAQHLGALLGHAELLQEIGELKGAPLRIDIGHYRGFKEALLYESLRSRRYNTPFCVFVIRVNRYPAYRDAYGTHQAGILARQVKEYLKQNLRDVDSLFPLAQDEFAVISPHLTKETVETVVSRIHHGSWQIPAHRPITLTVGVYSSPSKTPPDDIWERFMRVFEESGNQDENSVVFLP